MTDCTNAELKDLLPALGQGTLDAAGEASVRTHVAACADCRAELALLEAVRVHADAVTPRVDTSAILAGVLRATARPRVLPLKPRRPWRARSYVAAAASVLFVGALSLSAIARTFGTPDGASLGGSPALSGDVDSAADVPVFAMAGLSVGGGLSDLTDAELQSLLTELEQVEATVIEEPSTLREPFVDTPVNDTPEGF